ncbi:DUF6985 domain-containing protein [Flavobacterium johnsoniae]|uniref:DUF6985 domain-containing protein n=1 Tax=Flavobacterium johnsoniae TaxID=986 RepID=UPI0011ECDC8E|nr:hypothetical protein [Flavobacterium johnsoniae]
MGHKFWGKVNENWIGFLSDVKFKTPYLKKEEIEIYLGRDTSIPSEQEMDDYEKTFRSFLDNIEVVISEIKKETFTRYKNIYAKYYEDFHRSGEKPLNLDTEDKHFEYVQDILYIRILKRNTLKILIRYDLDTEHGIEIKMKNNKIIAIGGIAA